MELEPSPSVSFKLATDRRPHIPEPLPVRLIAVADARLPAPAGSERELDDFYVGLLGFERDPNPSHRAYRAENFRLHFDVLEPLIVRNDIRALGIEVLSLTEAVQKLIDAEIEYTRQRHLMPGRESLLLLDPAGNWIELSEAKGVR